MQIFDTHCHYNLEPLFSDNEQQPNKWLDHWQTAQKNGVRKSAVVGTDLSSCQLALEICQDQPSLYPTLGIHPSEFVETNQAQDTVDTWVQLVAKYHTQIIAIGEIGLDFFRLPKDVAAASQTKAAQNWALAEQLKTAVQHQLPVLLHVRDTDTPSQPTLGNAYWDVLAAVEEVVPQNYPMVLHCASGPQEYVQAMVNRGAYVSFAGNITYPSANNLRSLVEIVPPDKILVETDAPFLAPQNHRGKVCQPWMIADTVKYLESELQIAPSQLWQNAVTLFQVDGKIS